MKIVMLTLGRRYAGPVYSLEMAKNIAKKIDLICIISQEITNKSKWYDNDFEIIEYSTYKNMKEFLINSLKINKFFNIRKKIKELNPDYIYIPMPHIWDVFITLGLGIKTVITIHDPKSHLGEKNIILDFLRYLQNKSASKIILLSEKFKEDVKTKLRKKDEEIFIIPHPNFDYYKKDDIQTKYSNNKILFFGRIYPYKGLEILLKSFEKVIKKYPKLKLVIAGDGDISQYLNYFDNLKNNLELNIEFIPDEEVHNYFENIDFVVVPYIEATQSGVIPLAYSFGKTVIATDVGGISEQVENNKTGILINPNNEEELREKIEFLLENKDLVRKYGENALKRSKNEMSWEQAGDILVSNL